MSSLKEIKQSVRLHVTSGKGFSLVVAILAILILTALGYLVVMMSTQDTRASARVVGEKKAMAATETGVHQFMANFDPQQHNATNWLDSTAVPFRTGTTSDVTSAYTIGLPTTPTTGPVTWPIPGTSGFRYLALVVDITGTSAKYNSTVTVQAGINSMTTPDTTEYELAK